MDSEPLSLPEVRLISPRVFEDERGRFLETWSDQRYRDVGVPAAFRQDNVSVSKYGVLRGLHCQHPQGQGKLVTVLRGSVYDVVVDVRVGSPRFTHWVGVTLDDSALKQLYVPPGFLHGFVALTEDAVFSYKCTDWYDPASQFSVRWDDPSIGINWPVAVPTLSGKDAAAPLLNTLPFDRLPVYSTSMLP